MFALSKMLENKNILFYIIHIVKYSQSQEEGGYFKE